MKVFAGSENFPERPQLNSFGLTLTIERYLLHGFRDHPKRTRNRYVVDTIAIDKTNGTKAVVYGACIDDGLVYVRDLNEFSVKFTADAQLSIELD